MPEFADFQQNAKLLTKKLTGILSKSQGCILFFKKLAPNDHVITDAYLISMVADCLDEGKDSDLIAYLQRLKKHSLLTVDELDDFKTKALIGCYLLKWRQYSGSVLSYVNQALIGCFKQDLSINSLDDLEEAYLNSCLKTFSQYCSFIYDNRANRVYSDLNNQLGQSIQVEIDAALHPSDTHSLLPQEVYDGVARVLGMK